MKFILVLLFFVVSCTHRPEIIRGYKGPGLTSILKHVKGKSYTEILEIMGNPAMKGFCKSCGKGKEDIYRIIYMKNDMTRFDLELTYNTDANLKCVVLDLKKNPKTQKYILDNSAVIYRAKNCTQKSGTIMRFQQILEAQATPGK